MNERQERRDRFFEYFRERVRTAANSQVPSTDRLILVIACLDALANHWMTTSPPPQQMWHGERLRRFLAQHGGHDAWSRVSSPLVRNKVTDALAKEDVERRFPFAFYEPRPTGEVATWKNDPTFNELEQMNLIDSRILVECSYAGIVYTNLRCGWLHESRPGSPFVQTPSHDELADGEPRYRCDFGTCAVSLIVPLTFLVQSAERAVGSFEAEATERDIVPYELRS